MNMLNAYKLLTLPASLFTLVPFAFSIRGRSRLWERYGCWQHGAQSLPAQPLFCFHAASLGEMNGLNPVLERFRAKFPQASVLCTSTSVTGLGRARAELTRLLPFDHPIWIRRALDPLDIKMFVFSETELWPALLEYLHKRKIPLALINATISDSSIKSYRRFRSLFAPLLSEIKLVMAADEISRDRLIELGCNSDIIVSGNSKYDIQPSVLSSESALALKSQYFSNSLPVLVLGSVHPGEELPWLSALSKFPEIRKSLNLIVAPRHAEKFAYFAKRLAEFGFAFRRRSETGALAQDSAASVVLLDTLGELERVYSFAELAFIGGSLENLGGHNPLEAAAYGAAICMGPHVHRVALIDQELSRVGALLRIRNEQDVLNLLQKMRERSGELLAAGKSAKQVWESFSGASERIVTELMRLSRQ